MVVRTKEMPTWRLAPSALARSRAGQFAIGVKQIHGREGDRKYFWEFDLTGVIGYSMYAYFVTLDGADRVRRKFGLSELEKHGASIARWTRGGSSGDS